MTRPTFATTIITCLVLAATFAAAGPAPQDDPDVSQRFDRISTLRAEGRYDQAITELQQIIKQFIDSDEVLRRAFNELVYSILQKRDALPSDAVEDKQRLNEEVAIQAEAALRRFPDLMGDAAYVNPDDVNLIYDLVRANIFGSLNVTSTPDSCNIFIDDEFYGATPVVIKYFPVGEYKLIVTKSGFVDEAHDLKINPTVRTDLPLILQQERTKKWWVTRVFAPVTAGVGAIVALIIANQPEDPAAPEDPDPLPAPPDPPTQ